MKSYFREINSITELCTLYGSDKPKHSLVIVIDLAKNRIERPVNVQHYRINLYSILCKKFSGTLRYGRGHYDFSEGTLMFTAPGQVISAGNSPHPDEGWGLFFHPDLLHNSGLGRKIHQHSFFHYEVNEALHISDEEKRILKDCVNKIETEYIGHIDKHTQGLIQSNLETLLNYCNRFYDRQFYTRERVNTDLIQQFESLLTAYFSKESLIADGIPGVNYFASRLNLSPNYLTDLLNKFTGKTTQEHIHLQLVDKAKNLLWSTNKSVSEVAFALGFEHPSHFSKMFKNKTGYTPKAYRHLN